MLIGNASFVCILPSSKISKPEGKMLIRNCCLSRHLANNYELYCLQWDILTTLTLNNLQYHHSYNKHIMGCHQSFQLTLALLKVPIPSIGLVQARIPY